MSMSLRTSVRSCRKAVRCSAQTSPCTYYSQRRRWESTAAAGTATGAGADASASSAPANPKITQIVDQISQLNLLETADLVSTLKTRLNIPDLPVGGFAMGGAPGQAGAAAAPAEEEEEAPAVQEKTLFNLKLESFEDGSKPKVIKEIKSLLGLSLVDSKKFVEGAPKVMKESVSKDEGQKIIDTFKALGAKTVME